MSDIKVEHVSAAQVFEDDTFISRRLIRRDHGSEEMSFNVATLHENYNDQNCVYPDYDEIVYVLTGKAESAGLQAAEGSNQEHEASLSGHSISFLL